MNSQKICCTVLTILVVLVFFVTIQRLYENKKKIQDDFDDIVEMFAVGDTELEAAKKVAKESGHNPDESEAAGLAAKKAMDDTNDAAKAAQAGVAAAKALQAKYSSQAATAAGEAAGAATDEATSILAGIAAAVGQKAFELAKTKGKTDVDANLSKTKAIEYITANGTAEEQDYKKQPIYDALKLAEEIGNEKDSKLDDSQLKTLGNLVDNSKRERERWSRNFFDHQDPPKPD